MVEDTAITMKRERGVTRAPLKRSIKLVYLLLCIIAVYCFNQAYLASSTSLGFEMFIYAFEAPEKAIHKNNPMSKMENSDKNQDAGIEKRENMLDTKEHQQRSLIFGVGFGTTATHAMYEATCSIGLCTVHYYLDCCGTARRKTMRKALRKTMRKTEGIPSAGLLAHERSIRAFEAVRSCLALSSKKSSIVCPSVNITLQAMTTHIDDVLQSMEIDVIHDTPYVEFADYIMGGAVQRIRGSKPIILLSERDPEKWANRRFERGFGVVCRDNSTATTFSPTGMNMYKCLLAAVEHGLGASSISDVLVATKGIEKPTEDMIQKTIMGFEDHQNSMREVAEYSVNLFERKPPLETSDLVYEVKAALQRTTWTNATSELKDIPTPLHRKLNYRWFVQNPRVCMGSYETTIVSGRHCNKLIVFLHFHKGGGTSIIDYLYSRGLRSDVGLNSNPQEYDEFHPGEDVRVAGKDHNLRLNSSAFPTRSSENDFWWSLYLRGLDFVSLEYNFLSPQDFFNTKSSFWTFTSIRNPWDRFRSTYERELFLRCEGKKGSISEACYRENTLERWMQNRTGVLTERRLNHWRGILYPNYHVRMLNGIADIIHDVELEEKHLDIAKKVLDSFDFILIVEDTDETKLDKLCNFLGSDLHWSDNYSGRNRTAMPHSTNNGLKDDPLYEIIRKESLQMQPLFHRMNSLDIQLYEHARRITNSE